MELEPSAYLFHIKRTTSTRVESIQFAAIDYNLADGEKLLGKTPLYTSDAIDEIREKLVSSIFNNEASTVVDNTNPLLFVRGSEEAINAVEMAIAKMNVFEDLLKKYMKEENY